MVRKVKVLVSVMSDLVNLWTVAHQAPPSMKFSRQQSGLPFLSSGDRPDPGIEPRSHAWQADSLPSVQPRSPLVVKTLPAMQEIWETCVQSLGQEDTLEEGMGTHSSILAWRIPWTEEPLGL